MSLHTSSTISVCENTTDENKSSLDKVLACIKNSILGIRDVKFLSRLVKFFIEKG